MVKSRVTCFFLILYVFSKPENSDVWISNFGFNTEHSERGGFSYGERLEESCEDAGLWWKGRYGSPHYHPFFFFNLEDPANHLKVIGLIIRPSSREILSPPDIMELLNFAAECGKWWGAEEQLPVGSSAEAYVAKIATCDFVQKAWWILRPPDTVYKSLNLPVFFEAFRNWEVEPYLVCQFSRGQGERWYGYSPKTTVATQGKSRPSKQNPGDQKPSLDVLSWSLCKCPGCHMRGSQGSEAGLEGSQRCFAKSWVTTGRDTHSTRQTTWAPSQAEAAIWTLIPNGRARQVVKILGKTQMSGRS